MKNSNLDERQEQILLKLEHNTCWIAYWGLLAAMLMQVLLYGFDPARLAGEWCVFMVMCVYLLYTCLKNGIWDRRLKPDLKTNIIVSAIAAIVLGIVTAVAICSRIDAEVLDYVLTFGGTTVFTFTLCFIFISITARSYKKKQEKLEAETEE